MAKIKDKVLSVVSLKKKIAQARRQGKKVAFTNGCFDLLHIGHVSYLEEASKPNQILIVGLNSDSSVKQIKGSKRPIVPQQERAKVLAALASIDYVTIFNEDTPKALITALKPDVIIKGADWKGKEVVGSDVVKSYGGKVRLIKYLPEHSSTNIIQSILEKCQA